MTDERRTIVTPRGTFVLRPERPEDDPFLFRLFVANNIQILQMAGFAPEMIEKLIAVQHRSQTATYRGMFPHAIYSIVEFEGQEVGTRRRPYPGADGGMGGTRARDTRRNTHEQRAVPADVPQARIRRDEVSRERVRRDALVSAAGDRRRLK